MPERDEHGLVAGTRRTTSPPPRPPRRRAARNPGWSRSAACPAWPGPCPPRTTRPRCARQVPHRRALGARRVVPVDARPPRPRSAPRTPRAAWSPTRAGTPAPVPRSDRGHRAVREDDRRGDVRNGPVEAVPTAVRSAERSSTRSHRGRRGDLVAMAVNDPTTTRRIRIGTSGWRYPPWRGMFYPEGLPQRRELAHLSAPLDTIEINGSFYSLQRPESYRAWARGDARRLRLRRQGPRFITHMKQLRDVATPLANFLASGVLALGPKLGPLLWQLRRGCGFDAARIDEFLALLPRTHRCRGAARGRARRAARRARADHDRRRPAASARAGGPPRELPRPGVRRAAARARRRARRGRHRRDVARPRRRDRRLRLRPPARRRRSSTPAATPPRRSTAGRAGAGVARGVAAGSTRWRRRRPDARRVRLLRQRREGARPVRRDRARRTGRLTRRLPGMNPRCSRGAATRWRGPRAVRWTTRRRPCWPSGSASWRSPRI